ncbi:MAG: GNAT family N-acetyltransferase [Lewinellaceae bacterium]|nr:GNAT family N-acetyltransferase [Saprospiraceae bacterium]MCB9345435.1 GNAT family N-acetyltransferase [Lewinellaceae bacterium]
MVICQISFATPEFDEALALRTEVLRKPLGMVYTLDQLADEWNNIHIAAFGDGGQVSGYLNLTPLNTISVKMRQVAVASEEQGKGIGVAMVSYSEQLAAMLQFKEIVLHARKTAVPFYLKLGYEIVGDEFEEVSIPHFKMKKETGF